MPDAAAFRPPSSKSKSVPARWRDKYAGTLHFSSLATMSGGLPRSTLALPIAVGALAIAAALTSIAAAPDLRGVLAAGLALIMLAIAVIDGQRFIIPNGLVAAGFGLGLLYAGVLGWPNPVETIALAVFRGALLAALFLAIRIGYRRIRGREGIGLGDVKLAAVAGVWLDWQAIALAVEIAALSALAAYGLRQWVLGRPMRRMGRLPLGAFLAPAIWLCWLLDTVLFAAH